MSDTIETPQPDTPKSRRKTIMVVIAVVAFLGLAFGGFAIWFLQDDAPDEVSIDDAVAQLDSGDDEADDEAATDDGETATETTEGETATETTEGNTDAPTTTAATDGENAEGTADPSGTWNVDTTIGEFSYEDSTGTFVGFRVAEELSGIGEVDAVGRTPAVSGTLTIDGTSITDVSIEADMTEITTNDGRRDNAVRGALGTNEFPTATFELTEPIELSDDALEGSPIAVDAVGDLTVHGVTQNVTFPLEAQLVNDAIVVVGSLNVVFADYDVQVPSAPIVLSAADNGPIELQLFFTR